MAKGDPRSDVLRPSLIDRLFEGERAGVRTEVGVGVRQLKESVARDLEWLLNSHQSLPDGAEGLDEAKRSLLWYGLPDLSLFSWSSPDDSTAMCRVIEEAVRRFEPRLAPHTVRVVPVARGSVDDFHMRFRIDGVLDVDPVVEPVSYDTNFQIDTGDVQVSRVD